MRIDRKTALWQTADAVNYPFVHVTYTGAHMEMHTLDLRLATAN